MAKFDESKVINALHRDKAKIGKNYYVSDFISNLKKYVESDNSCYVCKLRVINCSSDHCFEVNDGIRWELLYPCEEPPKKLMTNYQLMEWLAKGNGQLSNIEWEYVCAYHDYDKMFDEDEVSDSFRIHPWNSDKWVEPTLDIYERDCKNISR